MNKLKHIETSKKLLLFADILTAIVTAATIVIVFLTRDTTPLIYLIPAVFGLSGTVHAFYLWKAKCENLQKYGREDQITMNDGGGY